METTENQKAPRLFFSSRRFITGQEGVQSTFIEGDFLYARVLLEKPLSTYASGNVVTLDVYYRAEEDDSETPQFIKVDISKMDRESFTLDFDLLPEKPTTVFADFASAPALLEMVMNQADAEMPVHFRITLAGQEGSFTYTKTSDDSFFQWANTVRSSSVALTKDVEAENTFLPDVFEKESHAFEDPLLSRENIIAYLSKNVEVKKLVIGPGPDYVVERNILGNILALRTRRYIMVAYKANNGYCYFGNCTFYRAYLGGENYGSPEITTVSIDTRIDCRNIQ